LCVRKSFDVPPEIKGARIRISADSRYILFLNGERLGQGPVRSWPFEQSYDVYDVGSRLRRNKNAVAVLVQHFGVLTSQYIVGRGGLLCQIDLDLGSRGIRSIGTGPSWHVRSSEAYNRIVPRINGQQGWIESYDARKEFDGWTLANFDDSDWKRAKVIGPWA
jgi:hypothetical protein